MHKVYVSVSAHANPSTIRECILFFGAKGGYQVVQWKEDLSLIENYKLMNSCDFLVLVPPDIADQLKGYKCYVGKGQRSQMTSFREDHDTSRITIYDRSRLHHSFIKVFAYYTCNSGDYKYRNTCITCDDKKLSWDAYITSIQEDVKYNPSTFEQVLDQASQLNNQESMWYQKEHPSIHYPSAPIHYPDSSCKIHLALFTGFL